MKNKKFKKWKKSQRQRRKKREVLINLIFTGEELKKIFENAKRVKLSPQNYVLKLLKKETRRYLNNEG